VKHIFEWLIDNQEWLKNLSLIILGGIGIYLGIRMLAVYDLVRPTLNNILEPIFTAFFILVWFFFFVGGMFSVALGAVLTFNYLTDKKHHGRRENWVYELREGNEIVYYGMSNDPDRKLPEDIDKHYNQVNIISTGLGFYAAEWRQAKEIQRYQRQHGGIPPKYNAWVKSRFQGQGKDDHTWKKFIKEFVILPEEFLEDSYCKVDPIVRTG